MNTGKKEHLQSTVDVLNRARAFYVDFFLAHPEKFSEKVAYFSEKKGKWRERLLTSDELLSWAESLTVATADHPNPLPEWDFSLRFPGMPVVYRRSVIKDAIGRVRSYLSNLARWERSGKKRGKPGRPGPANHPTLYAGALELELEELDHRDAFVRIKVYDGASWVWENYPVKSGRWQAERLREEGWEVQSPKLVLRRGRAELHVPQVRAVRARRVEEAKRDPGLVTVAVDLNVKNLAVITVRHHGLIVRALFVRDRGLDRHRYLHMKVVSKHQWQSGKPVKGERADARLWDHVRRTNRDFAHKVSRVIADVCARYPGCVLIFERLRRPRSKGESRSRRLNRKLANQSLIRDYARYKAYAAGVVTVEVDPRGTSDYCSWCGARGERFSLRGGARVKERGGKLFYCPACGYEANADFNASVNLHHSFYGELRWRPRPRPACRTAGGRSAREGHPHDGAPCPHADERARKVVGLQLARRGEVPARVAPRA